MRRVIESLCFLAVVAAGLVLADAASAESRLFSAKASQPGVIIVQAVRNGQQLPIAGQTGAAIFFRVDNPSGPVPCFNRIIFTASNGQRADSQVNICINNGALTVALTGSGSGGGAPGGGTIPAGGGPAGGSQPVVIATDDPYVTITNVFLRGKPVPIAGRQDPYVQINVLGGPQGFECSRDLGLALSDGRRIARLVDICQSNFLVIVALVGGPRPPAPPPSLMPPMIQPPVVQPLPTLPQPEQPEQPEVVDSMQWLFSQSGNHASFAYAIPETDASEFTAVCTTRSSKVTITLTRSADEVGPGSKVLVRFTAGAFAKTYTATGSVVSELDGISHPVLQIATSDPLWSALIKESFVAIAIGSSPPYALTLTGSALKAKQFLATCNPPPPLLEPPVVGGGGNAVGYACDDGSSLTVAYDATSAVVSEIGVPPIFLFQAPSDDGSVRYIAGLNELIGEGEQIFWTREGSFSRACMPN